MNASAVLGFIWSCKAGSSFVGHCSVLYRSAAPCSCAHLRFGAQPGYLPMYCPYAHLPVASVACCQPWLALASWTSLSCVMQLSTIAVAALACAAPAFGRDLMGASMAPAPAFTSGAALITDADIVSYHLCKAGAEFLLALSECKSSLTRHYANRRKLLLWCTFPCCSAAISVALQAVVSCATLASVLFSVL